MVGNIQKILKFLVGIVFILSGVWGSLAMYSIGTFDPNVNLAISLIFFTFSLGAVVGIIYVKKSLILVYCGAFLVIIGWFFFLSPSNNRLWHSDVAVLPYATIENNLITIHNVRNFTYRSEFDYTPAYYTKTYDLKKLQGVDVIAVYWMGPQIAHIFLSFDFGGEDHLAISIEARKEKSESYSTIKGFFRQYELYYVVADERDLIGLRTNYRNNPPEDVYVYRAIGHTGDATRLFLKYVEQINALKEKAQFYNSLTTNCTTTIWLNSLVNPDALPFNWKVLVSGYVPLYLYENGRLQNSGSSFDELQKSAWINDKAHKGGIADDFSSKIRHFDDNAVNKVIRDE